MHKSTVKQRLLIEEVVDTENEDVDEYPDEAFEQDMQRIKEYFHTPENRAYLKLLLDTVRLYDRGKACQ